MKVRKNPETPRDTLDQFKKNGYMITSYNGNTGLDYALSLLTQPFSTDIHAMAFMVIANTPLRETGRMLTAFLEVHTDTIAPFFLSQLHTLAWNLSFEKNQAYR